jgi:hypothetical protein
MAMYPCSFCFRFYRRIYEEAVIYEYIHPSSTSLLSICVHMVYISVATSSSHVHMHLSFGLPDIARHYVIIMLANLNHIVWNTNSVCE